MDQHLFHLRLGVDKPFPESCTDPTSCTLTEGLHWSTYEEAEAHQAQTASRRHLFPPAFRKADLPILRESERTGKSILELRAEGW